MARHAAAGRTTAGSSTLPIFSLYNSADTNAHIVEIGITNTAAVAVSFEVLRVSTTGTQGTTITEAAEDGVTRASSCQAFNTHSVAPTKVAGAIRAVTLGAAVGAGVVWTFGAIGLETGVVGTGIGVAIFPVGTGQACDVWIVWDE